MKPRMFCVKGSPDQKRNKAGCQKGAIMKPGMFATQRWSWQAQARRYVLYIAYTGYDHVSYVQGNRGQYMQATPLMTLAGVKPRRKA